MVAEINENHCGKRIHAIVLTCDRPETLRRCLATALPSLGADDMLTVLDDSVASLCSARSVLSAVGARVEGPTRVHLSTSRAIEVVSKASPAAQSVFLSKVASRDIAPLRNLSLLFSAVVPAQTTILIDDDIHGFDLESSHNLIDKFAIASPGVIIGSEMEGISEVDMITRLTHAVDMLERRPAGASTESPRDLFRVPNCSHSGSECETAYVSGGYLAFRVPPHLLFAFPPGYNEDWLWCLLHGKNARVRVLRSGSGVIHDPPTIKMPTREDVLFELVGDLVFDCLEEAQRAKDSEPEVALAGLARKPPSLDSMPAARVSELMEKTRSFIQDHGPLSVLEDYGLRILADMLRTGELEMDGNGVLAEWCADALAKHDSFVAILRNESTTHALKQLVQDETIS